MPNRLKCHFGAIILCFSIGGCQRLKEASQEAHFSVLESDSLCGETTSHTLEIELHVPKSPGRALITMNGESSSWEKISSILRDAYALRKEKFVYLRIDPGVSDSDQRAMFYLIKDAGTERLCYLDSKAPHKYIDSLQGSG